MANSEEFVRHVCELLAPAGRVSTRRMFGGHGVYLDDLFMAIIDDDEFYLKADAITLPVFEREDCAPFVYSKEGQSMSLNYRRAPEEAMEAPHLMRPWAKLALEAALRAAAGKKKTAKKKPTKK